MEIQTTVLQSVSDFLGISIGQLPETGGTVMQLAPASSPTTFMDGSAYEQMPILVLSKQRLQQNALDSLNRICNQCKTLDFPSGESWQITNISISTAPNYVGQEKDADGNMWIYSCILTVNYYNMEGF